MNRLQDKIAIVTGAGRVGNIGVAICDAYLREGAKAVVGTDLRTDEAAQIISEIEAKHGEGRFRLLAHDTTKEEDWRKVIDTTISEFGGIDILVNNAGISVHGGVESTPLHEMSKVMAVNHDALFLGMKLCIPALSESAHRFPGGGSIINTLSMASYMPSANNLSYQVSKAAGRMLTLCAAVELGPKRIRVNSVHPGLTVTPLLREAFQEYADQGLWESYEAAEDAVAAMGPLGIKSYPEDTAHAFVYLASDESRFVTGASLYHDGGIGQRF
ncbi:putative cyclopentanol dehydrogenase [Sphingobium herbicidovorans NBRC 16415]|uniref:Cyclopentanol dehydrogenase n=1 Tax=Sphingobium herbicidovorans (strain ATCC 700291 / DSM 11019 / CCUG 56400 / KCTC 2939 / LMG 18315 / NBRC 16415 / MH) TaxID=1219045 RepID=A0A086P7F4_SPHHM|nr:SDR family oxidoreductase [Sphingobium herbicidovorans]KFG89322.1 putative cyclopentanol dehydrogenase [Sphingobium herbicidovorans NBRC 16415]